MTTDLIATVAALSLSLLLLWVKVRYLGVLIRITVCTCVLTLALAAGEAVHADPSAEPVPQELSWIGLFNEELLNWLENENRLDELCGADRTSAAWGACRSEKLQGKSVEIAVRAEPRRDASRIGELRIVAWPGKGLEAHASDGASIATFTPDLYDVDWGYGPYFHQTVLARQNSWFRIPIPHVGAGWVDAREWWSGRDDWIDLTRTLREGDIINTPWGGRVVVGVQDYVLMMRRETEDDSMCDQERRPAAPSELIHMPFRLLFNDEGHLLVTYKDPRGC